MTLNELKRKTLEKLQVAAAGEPVAPEDTQLIASKYTNLHSLLLGKGLVSWAAADDIPEDAAEPVIMALAFVSAGEFGLDQNAFVAGAMDLVPPSLAEKQLRQIHTRRYVYFPQKTEYF